MPELPENPWLQLLSIQYPLIPILYYEEASAFREQLESLLLKETGGSLPTGNPCLSYAKSRSFLDNLTSLGSASPQEDPELPDYSHVSFAVCAARLSDSSCDDPTYEACAMLTRKYPNSFCYLNRKQKILLFVLYEHTGNFTQLELNRQTLMEQAAATDSFLPPFKFGVIHHGLSGLVSSFLEAEQVYYVNSPRVLTPASPQRQHHHTRQQNRNHFSHKQTIPSLTSFSLNAFNLPLHYSLTTIFIKEHYF